MAVIKEIRDGILARMATTLGGGYSKLTHVTDIASNKYNGNFKRYGVTAGSASEVSGTVGVRTMDHAFKLYLVDSYLSPTSTLDDDIKAELAVTLGDLAHGIIDDIQKNKSTLSTSGKVLIVNYLQLNEIKYLEAERVGVLEFEVNIKYKY